MNHKKEIVATFAKCFRLIAKLNVTIDDDFFVGLLNVESEKLLNQYVNFLKCEGSVVPARYVAQYGCDLILQIKNILSFLNILKHLKFAEPIPCLLLERNLLYLESSILDFKKRPITAAPKVVAGKQFSHKTVNKIIPKKLGAIHNEIASFLGGRGRVQNTEVFIKFAYITRRTLKRKLSELIDAGTIKRLTLGKKVFYQGVDKIIDET